MKGENQKQGFLLCILSIVLFLFWHNPLLHPLKVLVVYFHEMSHALATLLTGGSVIEIQLNIFGAGGHCISMGGIRFITLSSGYIGSLLWGVTLYLSALYSKKDREMTQAFGWVLLVSTLYFIPLANLTGKIFGIIMGGLFILLGKKGNEGTNDLTLKILGLTSILYAPRDIYDDLILRSELKSDGRMLAEEFFKGWPLLGSPLFWGTLWIALSGIIILIFLKLAFGKEKK